MSRHETTHWQRQLPSAALARGQVLATSCGGHDILLYRSAAGQCRAISAYCPHMNNYIPNGLAPGEPLAALLVEDELHCPFHGWRFNGAGQCTHIPSGQRVPAAVRSGRAIARTWRVREREGYIELAGCESQ
ncbi:MAG: Rieske 2Fe-2S domain-containing protein [Halioglobus sp.]|nr:Rieske 2Fe-2S domain-containing protein [Halioglobus sp.]